MTLDDARPTAPPADLADAQLSRDLAEALEQRALSLFYQPVMSLVSGSVLAVEALARWEHPQQGLVLAASIVPLAERAGLVADLDRWAIDEACRQLATWRRARGSARVPRVSVNVSADQLVEGDLVTTVSEALSRWSVRPCQLMLEFTETPALLTRAAAGRLAELQALGVRALLDDFGAGQSSLIHLRRLKLDGVKLDVQSIDDLAAGAAGVGRILAGMQTLTEGMGLDMVLTGIETQEQLEAARAAGCQAGEGLLLLGPVPTETLMDVFDLSRPRMSGGAAGFREAQPAGTEAERPGREQMLTLSEAAAMLHISHSTMRRWANDGRLCAVRTEGGHRRFRDSDVRRLAASGRPQLRVPTLPAGALPTVAAQLAAEGPDIAARAARALYQDEIGWFTSPGGETMLANWLTELASAFERGSSPDVAAGTNRLMRAAAREGVTLAERHAYVERFAAALRRRLIETNCPQVEQVAAARALAALGHQLLEKAEA